jgi:mutator protein MutT
MVENKPLSLSVFACIMLRRGNEVLLMQRADTGYLDGFWAVPGGSLDPHETVLQSAVREAREELNVILNPERLSLVHVLHTFPPAGNSLGFFFVTSDWEDEPKNMEPHKCSGMQWFAFDHLPDNVAPSARQVIERLQQSCDIDFSIYK